MKAKGHGTIDRIHGLHCKNGSYRRSFIVRYSESYRDKNGKVVHANMYQNFETFNEVARMVKADFNDGDEVYFLGDLKSRETEHNTIHFIEITRLKDLVKLPGGWDVS
jgi:hypothetical protein